ncbi:MupA/Atu3671 family FMN-dependent luciferase-like monooxygenase [Pseudoroseicyclus sp. H15]
MRTFLLIGDEALTAECAREIHAAGHKLTAVVSRHPGLLAWAAGAGVPAVAPGPGLAERLVGMQADWLISAANLTVLPPEVLAVGREGAVNFHDGPLPERAGLNAPVWALIEGERRHGISWHFIEGGIDEGDVIVERRFDIADDDTAFTLNARCFDAALESFPELLSLLAAGNPPRRKQDLSRRGYRGLADGAPQFGVLDLRQPAEELARLVRALDHGGYPNPLALPKLALADGRVTVSGAEPMAGGGEPGTVLGSTPGAVVVATGEGALRLTGPFDAPPPAGSRLPLIGRADEAVARAARAEPAWAARLANMAPMALQAADGTGGAPLQEVIPGATPALFAALASRLSGEGNALALSLPSAHPLDLCPWGPVRFDAALPLARAAEALEAEIAVARKCGPFTADMPARRQLGAAPMPAFALGEDGPLPGAALTLAGEVLHGDPAQLSPGQFALIASRLCHLVAKARHDRPAAEQDILPEAERKLLLTGWNDTAQPFDERRAIHTQIAEAGLQEPDEVAIAFEDRAITHAALGARANALAHALRAAGVTRGTLVGLHLTRSADLIAGALAIWKAGGAYVPLDPAYPASRLALYIEDSGAPVILTEKALAPGLPGDATLVLTEDVPQAADAPPEGGCEPGDLAYLIYTSGSTGRPKGVMLTHRNVSNFFTGMDARVPLKGDARWLAVTSLSFDISVLELFWTLARGVRVVLSGEESRALPSGGSNSSGPAMAFSLYYWGNTEGAAPGADTYRLLIEGAKFADANGFTAVWTPERHFHAFGGAYPNPSVTGAAVAAVTQNIGVRSGSCVAPLHHPARIAEEWAVIDNLTGGRAGLAIASGWQPDDFVLRPENAPPDNKRAMMETIGQLRRLWAGEAVAFPRADGALHEVVTQPRPVSKELPLWVTTAGNPDTWREAGRMGAHVLTHLLGQSIAEVKDKIVLYHDALREAGHDPADFTVTMMLHSYIAETREQAMAAARGPMKDYLRSAAGLIKGYAWAFPAFKKPAGVEKPADLDLTTLSDDEMEAVLDHAFERYFNESGLFGTQADARARVAELAAIGVGEVACLIDYGIPTDTVLAGLRPLADVVRQCAGPAPEEGDYSIAAQIARHDVTHLQCTPSMARMLLHDDDSRAALARLEVLMLGGEALPATLIEELRGITSAQILNMYGPTETTIWSTTAAADASQTIAPVGTPIANTQVYVLDEALKPCPVGVAGQLWIGGEGVAKGYWQREELTAERFRPDPFRLSGRIYDTGDLARWRADGALDFLGRADGQVKLRGHRIETGEIETVLEAAPDVAQAAVVLREDVAGPRLVAYVRPASAADEAALKARLAAALPAHFVPSRIVGIDEFPLTPNRKLDRKALPAPQPPRAATKPVALAEKALPAAQPIATLVPPAPAPQAPAGPAERISEAEARREIALIWAELLGVEPEGPEAQFFDLGGHSILAVQAHRAMKARFGLPRLAVTDIFRSPRLGDLAARVATLSAETASPLPRTLKPAPAEPPAPEPRPATSPAPEPADDSRAALMARRRRMRAERLGS